MRTGRETKNKIRADWRRGGARVFGYNRHASTAPALKKALVSVSGGGGRAPEGPPTSPLPPPPHPRGAALGLVTGGLDIILKSVE